MLHPRDGDRRNSPDQLRKYQSRARVAPMNRAFLAFLRLLRIGFAITVAVALVVQWISSNSKGGFNPANFFSYFTIQSNIIAAVVLAYLALRPKDSSLLAARIRGAATLYMATTGIVYALLLSGNPAAVAITLPWVNGVLHQIMPVYIVVDWIVLPSQRRLGFKDSLLWLIYPIVWLIYTLPRGAITGWYPYPFLNPAKAGGALGVTAYVVAITIGIILIAQAIRGLQHYRTRSVSP
jgi:hypothetical protein